MTQQYDGNENGQYMRGPFPRRRGLRCLGCRRFWRRQFCRCGQFLRNRFRGGRNRDNS